MIKITTTIIGCLFAVISIAQIREPQISIYPNPFVDAVTYELTVNYGDSLELNLYDLQGRIRLNLEKQPFFKSQTITLSSESLSNGLYITSVLIDTISINNMIFKNGTLGNMQLELAVTVMPLLPDELTIYPNPTNAELHLIVKSTTEEVEIFLYDLEGRKIINEMIENKNGIIRWNMNLTDLANGVYILHSKSANGKLFKKIAKSKR